MRAFYKCCRRLVAVGGFAAFGILTTFSWSVRPASAGEVYEFKAQSSSSERRAGNARKMRLGVPPKAKRESLSGGSRGLARRSTSGRRVAKKRRRGVRVASLGNSFQPKPEFGKPGTSLAGRGVRWIAKSGCLNPRLRAVVYAVASTFGPVTVNSTCRSRRHNARVGGARRSHHLSGNAVDFRVHGRNTRGVMAFLRRQSAVGGLKYYRRGFFHIDTGARRSW